MNNPQTSKTMKLDEFLSNQTKITAKAVVEEVPGDTSKIKLTPWTSAGGCACGSAIVLPKTTIAAVTPTGDTHFCCGKELSVVVVEFESGASLDLTELFCQLTSNLSQQENAFNSTTKAKPIGKNVLRPRIITGGPACVYEFCNDITGVRYCVTEDGVVWAAGSC